eukprot:symbB.v1.2.038534.t1/scaffold6029.1/size21614/1
MERPSPPALEEDAEDADGESEAGTSMASAEIGTNLEGDFAVLKTYLDHQF